MSNLGKLGGIAVIIGLILSVVGAFADMPEWFTWVLVLAGILTGIFNVSDAESRRFLLAAIGLIVAADAVDSIPMVGEHVTTVMNNLVVFLSPAVLLVALKSLFATVKD